MIKGYTITCSVCGLVKRTNYGEFKHKQANKTLDKHVCRECKRKK